MEETPGHINLKIGVKLWGIDWMKKEDLVEAVPPVYSHFIGSAFMRILCLR